MKFQTYIPQEPLRPYIKTLVISEVEEERVYKVLPSTTLVMGFQYRGRLSYIENDQEKTLSLSGVTGMRDTFRIFKNTSHVGSVLVIFREGAAPAFFRPPVHELFGKSISMDHFLPSSELSVVEEKLSLALGDQERIGIVEDFLLAKLRPISPDLLVKQALQHIHTSNGALRIKELANELCISLSPFEKRFRKTVGASPKKYASIVRFKSLLESPRFFANPVEAGFEAGYFDQAHFIKDFKVFTGQTPEQYRISGATT